MTSVFVGSQELTWWVKAHCTEVSLKSESLCKSGMTDNFGKGPLKRWKVTLVTQANSSQDLSENWKRMFLTGDVPEGSALIVRFIMVRLTHPTCAPDTGRQTCSKSYIARMSHVQQQESEPWTRLFAQRPRDPQDCFSFTQRVPVCSASSLKALFRQL